LPEKIFYGVPASGGIEIGPAYLYYAQGLTIPRRLLKPEEIDPELKRFQAALTKTRDQIKELEERAKQKLGEEHASIFSAHQVLLDDPLFTEDVARAVSADHVNSEFVLHEALENFKTVMASLNDEYFRERSGDIRDVGNRVLRNLLGKGDKEQLKKLGKEIILVANDLTPSDMVNLPTETIKAFCTDVGGKTSHVAIVSRSLGLPAVVGMRDATAEIQDGDVLIVDGTKGLVLVNPGPLIIEQYRHLKDEYIAFQKSLESFKNLSAVTPDGRHVVLAANIESPLELNEMSRYGAEGIGLYRTEFLYMNREDAPLEEEQFQAYKELAMKTGPNPAIIRTLDLGGDKFLSSLNDAEERNPFLGLRAIRLCLKKPEIFKIQLRAILRAAAYGPIKIMFPMISTLEEVLESKALLRECAEELKNEGQVFRSGVEVGVMIEIPSAAIIADILIQEVDFFSIGTNDLIQYSMAVDRANESVAYLYEPLNPAILRLISMTVEAAHKAGKWVGMCGEMAGDPQLVPLLLGMGLDELSASISVLSEIKRIIRMMPYEKAREIAQAAIRVKTSDEVFEIIRNNVPSEINSIPF
jgi:phosphotransferase system enzyme I (PtsI)